MLINHAAIISEIKRAHDKNDPSLIREIFVKARELHGIGPAEAQRMAHRSGGSTQPARCCCCIDPQADSHAQRAFPGKYGCNDGRIGAQEDISPVFDDHGSGMIHQSHTDHFGDGAGYGGHRADARMRSRLNHVSNDFRRGPATRPWTKCSQKFWVQIDITFQLVAAFEDRFPRESG